MIDATRARAIYLEAAQTRRYLATLLDSRLKPDASLLRAFEKLADSADNVGALLTRAQLAGMPDVLSARAEGP